MKISHIPSHLKIISIREIVLHCLCGPRKEGLDIDIHYEINFLPIYNIDSSYAMSNPHAYSNGSSFRMCGIFLHAKQELINGQ